MLAGSGDRQLQRSGERTEIGRRHAVGVRGAHNFKLRASLARSCSLARSVTGDGDRSSVYSGSLQRLTMTTT